MKDKNITMNTMNMKMNLDINVMNSDMKVKEKICLK